MFYDAYISHQLQQATPGFPNLMLLLADMIKLDVTDKHLVGKLLDSYSNNIIKFNPHARVSFLSLAAQAVSANGAISASAAFMKRYVKSNSHL